MTTAITNTRIRHDSPAAFAEWGLELSTQLAAIGLVKTADTGQIDWGAIASVPAANNNAGYEVWRFNDAAQSTNPIFFKLFYGTYGGSTAPHVTFRIGTGSDGAGALTGDSGVTYETGGNSGQTSDTARQSYYCMANGSFYLAHKLGATGTAGIALTGFHISRSTDNNGDANDEAFFFYNNGNSLSSTPSNSRVYHKTLGWGAARANQHLAACMPSGFYASSMADVNGVQQMGAAIVAIPTLRVNANLGLIYDSISQGTTFTCTPLGTTERTYLYTRNAIGSVFYFGGSGSYYSAVIWE